MKGRQKSGFGWVVVIVAAMAMIAAACGGNDKKESTSSGSGKTVTIGFVGAKTGDNANLGLNILPQRPWGGDIYGDFVRIPQPSNNEGKTTPSARLKIAARSRAWWRWTSALPAPP